MRDDRKPFDVGAPRSPKRLGFVGAVAGTFWIALMLVPARSGMELSLRYVTLMTLVLVAASVPMIFVRDRRLIGADPDTADDDTRGFGGIDGEGLALALGGLLALAGIAAIFWMMELFW